MKTKFFLLAVLPLFMFVSCEKHECNALSWTDYNSVEDVHCNFTYNADEFKQYIGDTLKAYGSLFKSEENYKQWQYLTSKKELQFTNNMARLLTNPFVTLFLNSCFDSIMPDAPYDSIVYVTGTIQYDPEPGAFYLLTNHIFKTLNYEN